MDAPDDEQESQAPEDRNGDVSSPMPHRRDRIDAARIDRLTERIVG